MTGDPAPGYAGQVFASVHDARINNAGQVAFAGRATGDDGSTVSGLWATSDSLRLKVGYGKPYPGAPAGTFGHNEWTNGYGFTDKGGLIFRARVLPEYNFGLFSDKSGEISVIAQEDYPAPGLDGEIIGDLFNQEFSVGSSGATAYIARLEGSQRHRALWKHVGDSSQILLRTGEPAPTAPSSSIEYFSRPQVNRDGDLALIVDYRMPGPDLLGGQLRSEVVVQHDGTWTPILTPGAAAPGTEDIFFHSIVSSRFRFNNAGQVAVQVGLGGEGVAQNGGRGIWSGDHEELELVVLLGDQAPGLDGVRFERNPLTGTTPLGVLDLTDNGDVSFWAVLNGEGVTHENLGSIWKWSGDELRLIARRGDPAPGTDLYFATVEDGSMNSAGQVVVQGYSALSRLDRNPSRGIWATSPEGDLRLIVHEGDIINTPSVLGSVQQRVVERVSLARHDTTQWNAATPLNDLGQLVVTLGFADGAEGVFVFDTTIPEPSTGWMLSLVVLLQTMRMRSGVDASRRTRRFVVSEHCGALARGPVRQICPTGRRGRSR